MDLLKGWYELKRLIALGDSVFAGYDGKKNGPKYIIQTLGQLAQVETTNIAVGGTCFTDPRGLIGQTASADFSKYDYVVIEFGINDFRFNVSPITQMQLALQGSITKMKQQNPNIQIFLTTPLQSWENGVSSLNQKNRIGVSQNDIDNMICSVARMNNLKCNDWRVNPIVTDANHNTTLGDGTVHPTAETQRLMAQRFFQVFFNGQAVSDDSGHHDSGNHNNNHHDDVPPSPQQISLVQLDLANDIIKDFNDNVSKILKALQNSDEEVSWQKEEPTIFNRACYLYFINTMTMLIDMVDDASSGTTYLDENGNELDNNALINPRKVQNLRLDSMLTILNHDFKYFEQLVNQMMM